MGCEKSKEEWKDIGRRIERQIKSELRRMADADETDDWKEVGKKLEGKTTSKVERVMKTVNMRTKIGKWSANGALNAIKVRLAHYYNDFDPLEEMEQKEVDVLHAAGKVVY